METDRDQLQLSQAHAPDSGDPVTDESDRRITSKNEPMSDACGFDS